MCTPCALLAAFGQQLRGAITAKAAEGHVSRIRAWEERTRAYWKTQKGEVYRMVREAPLGRTAFLKRADGTLTGNWQEMQEIAQQSTRFDDYTIAMLAALNIASEFDRFRRQVDEELATIDRDLASTAVFLDSALPGSPTE